MYLSFLRSVCVTAVPSTISSRKINQSFELNVAAEVFYGVTLHDVFFRIADYKKTQFNTLSSVPPQNTSAATLNRRFFPSVCQQIHLLPLNTYSCLCYLKLKPIARYFYRLRWIQPIGRRVGGDPKCHPPPRQEDRVGGRRIHGGGWTFWVPSSRRVGGGKSTPSRGARI